MSRETIRRQHRYTITPEHLILDPRVSDRAMRLWCRLDRYAGDNETAFPSRWTLAIQMDTSKASIDRALKELCDAGWLAKERRNVGDVNAYTLIVAPEKAVEKLVKQAIEARVAAAAPQMDREREKRREQKQKASVQSFADDASVQVTEGGVVTSDDTQTQGVSSPVTTGSRHQCAEAVVTHDDEKEASRKEASGRMQTLPSPVADATVEAEPLVLVGELVQTTPTASPFDEFWQAYPRKVGKEAARKAFTKACTKVDADLVVTGALRFSFDPNLPGPNERQFIPHPATWLNEGRWDDEPLPPRATRGGRVLNPQTGLEQTKHDTMTMLAQQYEAALAAENAQQRRIG